MPVKLHLQVLVVVLVALGTYGVFNYAATAASQSDIQEVKLPPLYFYDKQDQKVTLDHFKGQALLVNLWATWCVPCIAELPSLDRLQDKLASQNFKIVAISLDRSSLAEVNRFLQKKQVRHLQSYWDKDRQVPLKWKYEGLPTSFLLDEKGVILKRYDGPFEWDSKERMQEIKSLLKKEG